MKDIKLNRLLIVLFLSLFVLGNAQWVGRTVSGFLNPAVEDLDMNNNDIKMGTGLIGYDGTASKGLSFDSGNEKVTLESGQLLFPDGTKTLPSIASINNQDLGFYFLANAIDVSINDSIKFHFYSTDIEGAIGGAFACLNEDATATNPVFTTNQDFASGVGFAATGQPSLIGNSLEAQRWIPVADTDSDDTDVLLTGVSGFHGLVVVIVLTDNVSAIFHVDNVTVTGDISLNALITSTKDNAATYNFYYDTDQFKLQNKVGDNKSIKVVFWILPTS